MAKHKTNLMYATVQTGKAHKGFKEREVVVDRYAGNKYKVIATPNKDNSFLIGRTYEYGHGLINRRKIK